MMDGFPPRFGFYHRDEGAVAVEFALLAPIFFALLIGTMYLSMLAFSFVSLHFAAEDAARCAAVKTTVCTSAATTQTYAQGKFLGIGGTPSFTYTAASCGSQVTGTMTYTLDVGLYTVSVPLSATACYP
jgi:Flp pilus assembly protein TadG